MIDTLKLARGLQNAGMSAAQAEEIAEALNQAEADYSTKADLKAEIADLKTETAELRAGLEGKILDAKFQMLWGLAVVVGVQIITHFWR